jgi:hypothetical protein
MKRILLVILVVCLLAGQASAGIMYQMDATTAKDMRMLSVSGTDDGNLYYVGYNPGETAGDYVWGSRSKYGDTMYYAVGFTGNLADEDGGDSAIATIGLSSPSLDAGPYTGFILPISNDNDDTWRYQAYVTVSGSGTTYSGWATLTENQQTSLIVDLGGDVNFTNVTGIGFQIEWKPSLNPDPTSGDPRLSDEFHTSVVPVPAAVILGMLGLGVAGLKLRKFA